MSDPTRLTEAVGDDVTALERELLRAGKQARLPARHKDEIWMGLSLQIVPPVAPGDHGAGAGVAAGAAAKAAGGAKALTAAAALKGTLLAVALGGGSIAGYQVVTHRSAPPIAVEPGGFATPTARAPEAPEPLAFETSPASQPAVAPRSASPVGRTAREELAARRMQPSRLAAEGRVVLEARSALREGRVAEALRLLEAARGEFVDGALVQEREALTIEALARSGRPEAAAARASAFLRAYPGSPHAATVKSFARP